jgi:hypothetical protein
MEMGDDVADELGEELKSMLLYLITKACGMPAKQLLVIQRKFRVRCWRVLVAWAEHTRRGYGSLYLERGVKERGLDVGVIGEI